MPDKLTDQLTDQQKFRRLMRWAARVSSQYTDDELEQFANEYWAKQKEISDGKSINQDNDN